MLSVFGFVAFIVHASIFCLRFSQKQSANQPKKIQGNGLLLNIKAHAKIQALLKEKKFYPKKSLTSLLHQAIQLLIQRGLFSLNMNSLFYFKLKTDGGVIQNMETSGKRHSV